MNLIKNIEISYFRSLYQIKLKNLTHLNVISGQNDSGKSNLLKALNLFFKHETDWQVDIDFYKDFSLKRLSKVREDTIKGKQFISISIEFNRPKNFEGSLPSNFKLKRTWHRDGFFFDDTNNLKVLYKNKPEVFPSTLNSALRFLPVFLNRVHFEYIPAVKDRLYFDHLLSNLQKTLLNIPTGEDSTISDIAANLANHIQGKIGKLENDFKRATGIKSYVEPPNKFADLFQSFLVSTSNEKDRIPLISRGDGIQARFIFSVLHYICENSNDFFIWGFEEPENSLEYSKVIDLAHDLAGPYSKKAQIFITTHSPAFTSLRKSGTSCCYRIYNENGQSMAGQVFPEVKDSAEKAKLNIEMGFMKIQEEVHQEYIEQQEQLKKIKNRLGEIQLEMNKYKQPLILTEGKTDRQILEKAWVKLNGNIVQPFIFRAADPSSGIEGGSGGAIALARMIESIHPEENRKAIAIFDRDTEGSKSYNKLSNNFKIWNNDPNVKMHSNELAFALLLPIPSGRETYANHGNLYLEYLFPDETLLCRTLNNRGIEFEDPHIEGIIVGGKHVKFSGQQTFAFINNELEGLRKIRNGKSIFASDIVPYLHPSNFVNFVPLFLLFNNILSYNL
jgi:predicted ATPase